jgi:hypothetical protein
VKSVVKERPFRYSIASGPRLNRRSIILRLGKKPDFKENTWVYGGKKRGSGVSD